MASRQRARFTADQWNGSPARGGSLQFKCHYRSTTLVTLEGHFHGRTRLGWVRNLAVFWGFLWNSDDIIIVDPLGLCNLLASPDADEY